MSTSQSVSEVRRLRKRSGLTQQEAADRCGVPLRTFQSYDRGEHEPPAQKMDHIRNVLGDRERSVASVSQNGNLEGRHIKQYPVADSDDAPTVTIDSRIIDVRGGMPNNAEAHRVNDRWMGPWMDADLALIEPKKHIDGPGRYCLQWSEGEDKIVVEAWRHSDSKVCIRTHAPETTSIFEEVGRDGDSSIWVRQDGSELHVRLLGVVVYPTDSVQMMTKGMADTAARILEGGVTD